MKLTTAIDNIATLSDAGQKAVLRSLAYSMLGRYFQLFIAVHVDPATAAKKKGNSPFERPVAINIDEQTESLGMSPEMMVELTGQATMEVLAALDSRGLSLGSEKIVTLGGIKWIKTPIESSVEAMARTEITRAMPKGTSAFVVKAKAEARGITEAAMIDELTRKGLMGATPQEIDAYVGAAVRTLYAQHGEFQYGDDADLIEIDDTFVLDALVKAKKRYLTFDRIDEATLILLGDDIKQAESFA